jgi:hypothetical protein
MAVFKITGTYSRAQGHCRRYSYSIQGSETHWEGMVRFGSEVKGVVGGRLKDEVKDPPDHVRQLVEYAIEHLIQVRE